MGKGFSLLAGALVLFASVSGHAEHVFSEDAGRWHLNGYMDRNDPDNSSCVFSTKWNDGKRIQVNVFPKYDGSSNVTMTVLNPEWDYSAWDINNARKALVTFISGRYGDEEFDAWASIYTQNKVIFRGLNSKFVRRFIRSESMILFPSSDDELVVNLTGTAALSGLLNSCREAVLDNYQGDLGNNF